MARDMLIPFILKESDLKRLGECTLDDEDTGGTIFICHIHSMERMFIRTIVEALGFEVTSEVDLGRCYDKVDVMLETTYPWERYYSL